MNFFAIFVLISCCHYRTCHSFGFSPVDHRWRLQKCRELEFQLNDDNISQTNTHPVLNIPKDIKHILGDGNCFFNALSYVITGSQEYSPILRQLIVDHAIDSKSFKMLTSEDERYDRISRMYLNGEYAESPEVFTAAEFLKTSIYVFARDDWHLVSKNGVEKSDNSGRYIYLINHHEHYDVVTDVYPPFIDEAVSQEDETENSYDIASDMRNYDLSTKEPIAKAQLQEHYHGYDVWYSQFLVDYYKRLGYDIYDLYPEYV